MYRTPRLTQRTSESYNQILGVTGARKLDEAEGTTIRMDNLRLAKRMEREGIPAENMWFATGWMRGADRKWRYEIMDGTLKERHKVTPELVKEFDALLDKCSTHDYEEEAALIAQLEAMSPEELAAWQAENPPDYDEPDFDYSKLTAQELDRLNELDKYINPRLGDIFDAPELFRAYPELRDILVTEHSMDEGTWGQTVGEGFIRLNTNISDEEAKTTLIHEIQHVIQGIEGFAPGSDFNVSFDGVYRRWIEKAAALVVSLSDDVRDAIHAAASDGEDAPDGLSARELNIYNRLKKIYEKLDARYWMLYDKYQRHAGEVEARAAQELAARAPK